MKACVLAVIVLMLAGCGRAPEGAAASADAGPSGAVVSREHSDRISFPANSPMLRQIRTAPVVSAQTPEDEVVAPGKVVINPNRISRVLLPVAGRIAKVEVRLGDSVVQGQPLVRMESPEAEAALSDYLQATAGETRARADQAKALADFDRISDLYRHGAVAKKDVIDAEAGLAGAQAALKQAGATVQQTRRRLAILGLKPGEFGQQVIVAAPISGKVLEITVAPGEYRNDTSAPLITIADLNTVWVASDVPESSIRWIERGERVEIELAAYPGEVFRGRVMRVADTVNPQTRSVEVQTGLENRTGRFRPEMFARIRHSHGTRELPVVPQSAIVRSEQSAWVFVERTAGEFQRVRVEAAEAIGSVVPVLSGVEAGARVVVDGAILLQANGGTR